MDDSSRLLSPAGCRDAQALGRFMAARKFIPHHAFCSPAARTRQTFDALSGAAGACPAEHPPSLYNGSAGTIFHLVNAAPAEATDLLIVAHNPGVFNYVRVMAGSMEDELAIRFLAGGYPSGSLAVLAVLAESWSVLEPGACRLEGFYSPSDYSKSPVESSSRS